MKNKQKGITLVALIITVILLLILAGLTVELIVDDSVFNKTRDVVNDIEKQSEAKNDMVSEVRNLMKQQ